MNRGTYFAHGEMADLAQRAGVLSHEESEELRFLESQRVIADYFSEGITLGVAQQCLTAAQSLVARLDEAS